MKINYEKFVNLIFIGVIASVIIEFKETIDSHYEWYMIFISLNFVYLLFEIISSHFYKVYDGGKKRYTISVIVPFYNESLKSIQKLIRSLEKQTILVDEVILIDMD
ncbi:glycosyltransferase [Lactococcus lactis]|uniref:glycosyltransferase n=1 Tax=Lactococcus lactis TaxID=1358 RepID=UPI001D1886D7|nr:glycosyltransferase [Lactococcus lactis]MCC4121970.1 glycosyltransferase [Lactococcus lactis]